MKKTVYGGFITLAVALAAMDAAQAQYPTRTVRWIVPFAAGSGTDTVARFIQPQLAAALGQQVVIDNRPGAAGNLGAELAAKAPPDGYTLLLSGTAALSIAPSLYAKLPYDPAKDFAPVSLIATAPSILITHPALPVRTVKDVIALAKAKPGQLNFASAGIGTPPHLAGELFKSMAGVNMVHVPYKGGAQQVTALVAGEAQASLATVSTVIEQIRAGKLRPLGVNSLQRVAVLPDIPPIAQAGVPGYEMSPWIGVFAPAGTPRAIVDRLHAEIGKILQMPDVTRNLSNQALEPSVASVDQFNAIIRADYDKYGTLIRLAGARVE